MSNELYRERAQLAAALSKVFPASLEIDPADPDWMVCIIDLPTGQVSWHIALTDLDLFQHLPRDAGRVWDGHSTELKYMRLFALQRDMYLPDDGQYVMHKPLPMRDMSIRVLKPSQTYCAGVQVEDS